MPSRPSDYDISFLVSQNNTHEEYYTSSDQYKITNYVNYRPSYGSLENINVIVPEGFRDILSFNTDRSARLCIGNVLDYCELIYRMNINAMVQKLPGFLGFSGYGLV